MSKDQILQDEEVIARITAKVLDQIKEKQGVVCQGYFCNSSETADSRKQWNDVLAQHKIKFSAEALTKLAAMPLTYDEIVQTAVEFKTRERTSDAVATEDEAETAVRKILADNVLISRQGVKSLGYASIQQRASMCFCGYNTSHPYTCDTSGPNSAIPCPAIYDTRVCGVGPNAFCAKCGPNRPEFYATCNHSLDQPFNYSIFIRLQEQVAQLATEVRRLQTGQ